MCIRSPSTAGRECSALTDSTGVAVRVGPVSWVRSPRVDPGLPGLATARVRVLGTSGSGRVPAVDSRYARLIPRRPRLKLEPFAALEHTADLTPRAGPQEQRDQRDQRDQSLTAHIHKGHTQAHHTTHTLSDWTKEPCTAAGPYPLRPRLKPAQAIAFTLSWPHPYHRSSTTRNQHQHSFDLLHLGHYHLLFLPNTTHHARLLYYHRPHALLQLESAPMNAPTMVAQYQATAGPSRYQAPLPPPPTAPLAPIRTDPSIQSGSSSWSPLSPRSPNHVAPPPPLNMNMPQPQSRPQQHARELPAEPESPSTRNPLTDLMDTEKVYVEQLTFVIRVRTSLVGLLSC